MTEKQIIKQFSQNFTTAEKIANLKKNRKTYNKQSFAYNLISERINKLKK